MFMPILHYADYLIPQVKRMGIPNSAWKHIMMQIGANDLCQLCMQSQVGSGSGFADDFEAKIRAVLEYLKANLRTCISGYYIYNSWAYPDPLYIANTIVNLTGVFKVSALYQVRGVLPACTALILTCS